MSRIGKQPIAVPPKVKVEVKGQKVFVEGPKGKLDFELPHRTWLKVDGGNVVVSRDGDDSEAKALHGLSRAIVNNMVKGVTEGFVKKLEIQGVGFKAAVQGKNVNLALGFSHPINYHDSRPDQGDGRGKHQGDHRRAEQTGGRPGRRGNPQLSIRRNLTKAKVCVTRRKSRAQGRQDRPIINLPRPNPWRIKMRNDKKVKLAQLRHWRIRKKISGTKERPRMSVVFQNEHIYVQFIDDVARVTVASASTLQSPRRGKLAANATGAKKIGALAAEAAKGKGISQVVFDRSGARYHGKVKALADAAREAGLKF